MKTAKTINELLTYIQQKANSTLKQEVAKEVVKTMQEHVESDVYSYDAARPDLRRMYEGGLIDPDMIEVRVEKDNVISIENIAYDGNRNVPYIVESGEGYFPGASEQLTKGRKFTENTVKELKENERLNRAMKSGLKKRGLDVR